MRRQDRLWNTAIGEGFPPGQEWLFAYDAEKAVTGKDSHWQATAWRE